uniref:Leucine-rich repeat-containing protein 42 n=1 Tax=Strigamia maritima TaxID=126957 RepID=T1IZN2_STRMM
MAADIVYYREIGKPLKILTSPILRKIRREQRLKSRNVFTQSGMEKYWSQCVQSEKNDNVTSLFDTTIDFIAKNAETIESLVGIPEIIGEKLFSRYLYASFADHLIPTCETLKIFTNVYEEKMLYSLQLSNNSLTINEFLDLFQQLLTYVRELDLSKCLLGDNHEVIEQIRELKRLEYLNISDNALTDKTMRRLALGYPDSPVNLKYLDLSGNKRITNCGLEKLTCFRNLETLIISRINIDIEGISKKLNMEITNQSANYFIQTKGWSSPLIIGLVTAVNAMMNDEKATKDRRITRFYGNRQKICLNLFNEDNTSTETVILLRKRAITPEKPSKRKLP